MFVPCAHRPTIAEFGFGSERIRKLSVVFALTPPALAFGMAFNATCELGEASPLESKLDVDAGVDWDKGAGAPVGFGSGDGVGEGAGRPLLNFDANSRVMSKYKFPYVTLGSIIVPSTHSFQLVIMIHSGFVAIAACQVCR